MGLATVRVTATWPPHAPTWTLLYTRPFVLCFVCRFRDTLLCTNACRIRLESKSRSHRTSCQSRSTLTIANRVTLSSWCRLQLQKQKQNGVYSSSSSSLSVSLRNCINKINICLNSVRKRTTHLDKRLGRLEEMLATLWLRALGVPVDDCLVRNTVLVVQYLYRLVRQQRGQPADIGVLSESGGTPS